MKEGRGRGSDKESKRVKKGGLKRRRRISDSYYVKESKTNKCVI